MGHDGARARPYTVAALLLVRRPPAALDYIPILGCQVTEIRSTIGVRGYGGHGKTRSPPLRDGHRARTQRDGHRARARREWGSGAKGGRGSTETDRAPGSTAALPGALLPCTLKFCPFVDNSP